MEYGKEKKRLLDRWCDSEEIKKNYERLRQMFLLEEFKNYVHPEQKANTLSKAAEMADEYFLSHKHLLQKGSPQQTFQRTFHSNKNMFEVSLSSSKTTDSKPSDTKSTFRSLNGTQVKITVQLVSIVEKRVMLFQSVLLDKETKRQKAKRPSQMLLPH